MKKISKNWESSAKIDKCLEILDNIKKSDLNEKTIIFSLWTSMLDLVEVPLLQRGINYTRYDGSMSANERNEAVLDFQDESKDISVMLISLKAGNAGLNLVSASQVIILDPFWNGSVEDQAIDRAHRIGQTKEVHVHRIVVENTVEDRILQLQQQKRELVESALDENAAKAISRLGQQELSYLFVRNIISVYIMVLTLVSVGSSWVGWTSTSSTYASCSRSRCLNIAYSFLPISHHLPKIIVYF